MGGRLRPRRAKAFARMPAGDPARPLDSILQRGRDLAHQRLAYYSDLSRTGRWKLFFSEREFVERLRDVIAVTNAWNELAVRKVETGKRDAA